MGEEVFVPGYLGERHQVLCFFTKLSSLDRQKANKSESDTWGAIKQELVHHVSAKRDQVGEGIGHLPACPEVTIWAAKRRVMLSS